jgi:hypothetical protein
MRIQRLHHAQITIPSDKEAEARAFYCGALALGLRKIADSIPIEGYDRFEFRDPFGNRVEFIAPVGAV